MTNDTKTQVRVIEGWVRPAGVDVRGPGYELGSGCGWCEFNECGQPEHGDARATLIIGERGYSRTQMLAMVEEIVAKQAEYEEPDWIKAIASKHLGTGL